MMRDYETRRCRTNTKGNMLASAVKGFPTQILLKRKDKLIHV